MRKLALLLASFGALASACTADSSQRTGSAPPSEQPNPPTTPPDPATTPPATELETVEATTPPTTAPAPPPTFITRPGVEQLAILDAEPGATIRIAAPDGSTTAEGIVDAQGALLFRRLEPGDYRAVDENGGATPPAHVLARDEHPPAAFFAEQKLVAGFNYISTRDGTTLSATVHLPGPVEAGPFPTLVEYSGYTPSNPNDTTFAQLYNALGFAYVGVNMRGTGCSGGSFRFFEYTQSTDGYDAIEAVAAQPWVLEQRVGMVGISYPGISQLFVAQTRPPHLAAITPLSVLDDSIRATLYPGGILNTGFAVAWTKDRVDQAKPRGQQWAADRIDAGDAECEQNQALRLQNPDLMTEITENEFYTAEVGDDINPSLFVDKINVPVFLAGAWQDEQTGGHFPNFLDRFTGTDKLFVTLVNGLHTESIASSSIFAAYAEFLDLYVARRTPTGDAASAVAPLLGSSITGTNAPVALSPLRGKPFGEALLEYEARPRIRVLFEEGAADGLEPGAAAPRFEAGFTAWPIPQTLPTTWYLTAAGSTAATAATQQAVVSYTADPSAVPMTKFDGSSSGIWQAGARYNWVRNPVGTAAVWTSPPLDSNVTMIGTASADLWLTSTATNTDLEVTLTEIRPDGNEVYVQSGWLRASHRGLDETRSTMLNPVHPLTEEASSPLTPGEPTLVRVAIFPFGHVFRSGSQLRITVDAPGGNRASWAFDTISNGERNEIGVGGTRASSIVLPVVPGVEAPAGLPACGALRGQPCRSAG